MCEFDKKNNSRYVDVCMKRLISFINTHPNVKTLGSCCGHGRYNMSIVVRYKTETGRYKIMDLCSGIHLPRKVKFYKKDKDGYFYIPEVNK